MFNIKLVQRHSVVIKPPLYHLHGGNVSSSLCLIKHYAMKAYGSGCIDPYVLISVIIRSEWSASRPGRFTPRKSFPGTRWIGAPEPVLDHMEKTKFLTLPGLELRPVCRSARSQSLYRLSYPGSFCMVALRKSVKFPPG
jgi:hypothetical protein